jgi:hypothetical protein
MNWKKTIIQKKLKIIKLKNIGVWFNNYEI